VFPPFASNPFGCPQKNLATAAIGYYPPIRKKQSRLVLSQNVGWMFIAYMTYMPHDFPLAV